MWGVFNCKLDMRDLLKKDFYFFDLLVTKRFYCSFYREVRSVLNKPLMSLEWTMGPPYQN